MRERRKVERGKADSLEKQREENREQMKWTVIKYWNKMYTIPYIQIPDCDEYQGDFRHVKSLLNRWVILAEYSSAAVQ